MRTAATGAVVCLASWLGLWAGAGYVGLSRSVSVSPLTLVEVPMALVLAAALAFVAALALTRPTRGAHPLHPLRPLHLVAWILVGDLLGPRFSHRWPSASSRRYTPPSCSPPSPRSGYSRWPRGPAPGLRDGAYDLGHE